MPAVRRRRSFVPVLVLAVLASACGSVLGDDEIRGSGVAMTQARAVAPFRGVELRGVGVLTVESGAQRSVTVHGDDNVVRRVTTGVDGGVLVVGVKGHVRAQRELRIAVITPSIEALTLSGSGAITATGVRTRRLRVRLSGTGRMRAQGSATRLDVEVDGVGEALLANLRTPSAHVRLDGTGRVVVHAARSLDATVAGAGEVLYAGDPVVRSHVDGVGLIARAPS